MNAASAPILSFIEAEMLRIACPNCGERDEVEFRYRGDATLTRPGPDADSAAVNA
jgi:sarcosine oxidase delta subunit